MKKHLWCLALLFACLLQVGCGSREVLTSTSASPATDSPKDRLAAYVTAVQPAVNAWAESRGIEEVTGVQGASGSKVPQSEIRSMLRISELRRDAGRSLAKVEPPEAFVAAQDDLVRGLRLSSKEWALNAGAASQGIPFSEWYAIKHASRFEEPLYRAAQRWDQALTTASELLHISVPFRVPDVMRSKVVN